MERVKLGPNVSNQHLSVCLQVDREVQRTAGELNGVHTLATVNIIITSTNDEVVVTAVATQDVITQATHADISVVRPIKSHSPPCDAQFTRDKLISRQPNAAHVVLNEVKNLTAVIIRAICTVRTFQHGRKPDAIGEELQQRHLIADTTCTQI